MSAEISIRDIEKGIVFLMAEWSGPAQWAWRQLSDFVDNYDGAKPRIIKVDWQEAAPIFNLPELEGKIHAWGEALIVKHGQIIFFAVLGKKKGEIQERCRELLRAYED